MANVEMAKGSRKCSACGKFTVFGKTVRRFGKDKKEYSCSRCGEGYRTCEALKLQLS